MKLDFSHIKTATMRDKTWKVFWRKPPGPAPRPGYEHKGHCDSARNSGKRAYIDVDDADGVETLGTLVHETAHMAFPDLDELSVEEYERDLVRLCRRMKMRVTFEQS